MKGGVEPRRDCICGCGEKRNKKSKNCNIEIVSSLLQRERRRRPYAGLRATGVSAYAKAKRGRMPSAVCVGRDGGPMRDADENGGNRGGCIFHPSGGGGLGDLVHMHTDESTR